MTVTAPKACVIGSPISHSRSPLIHGYWLKKHGISGSYDRIEVKPDQLAGFLDRIRQGELAGCNVTIPLKELAFEAVDRTDDQTRRLKSVNTIFMEGGKLCGTSTDGMGFMANLCQTVPGWHTASKHLVILGAGGAARGLVDALITDGADRVSIVNRTLERAEAIAADYPGKATARTWSSLNDLLPVADLLVNSTSLGMTGQPPLELPLDGLKREAVVADIVYVPLQTDLLRQAAERGHQVVEGLGMLLHQAVPGFEKWFGTRPEVTDELRDLIIADITGRQAG
ncbi:MAG: shikimate dehydrogenase [Hyphomicrobiales bacterium]|nr:shikimate dehydrogenase [Hyphomicrobiales bacterium]